MPRRGFLAGEVFRSSFWWLVCESLVMCMAQKIFLIATIWSPMGRLAVFLVMTFARTAVAPQMWLMLIDPAENVQLQLETLKLSHGVRTVQLFSVSANAWGTCIWWQLVSLEAFRHFNMLVQVVWPALGDLPHVGNTRWFSCYIHGQGVKGFVSFIMRRGMWHQGRWSRPRDKTRILCHQINLCLYTSFPF